MSMPHATRVTRWALRPIEQVFDAISVPSIHPSWLVDRTSLNSFVACLNEHPERG